jgi:colanic acid/amylovoran biosynthesis protein
VGSAFGQAGLMVASGGGFIADAFRGQTWSVLERLGAAAKGGATVALFGQGIGPLRDRVLLEKAREVLPSAAVVGVRERLTSLPLLESLGVPRERIVVTGDDAVEPAYLSRGDGAGEYVGVNLRVAGYARVGREMIGRVREPLQHVARRLKSRMIALPISLSGDVESASDAAAAESLIAGPFAAGETYEEPREPHAIIERIGRCRVVVTGSYHAAVFALAQGIPAVCLSNSEYYEAKFRGLADLFGVGVEVLSLSDRPWPRGNKPTRGGPGCCCRPSGRCGRAEPLTNVCTGWSNRTGKGGRQGACLRRQKSEVLSGRPEPSAQQSPRHKSF